MLSITFLRQCILILMLSISMGYADTYTAPVENQNDILVPMGNPHPLSWQGRMTRLENQVNNLQQMNLSGEIQRLQEEIQSLRGQLQVQSHRIQELQEVQNKNIIIQEKSLQASTNNATRDFTGNDLDSYKFAYQYIVNKKYDAAIKAFQAYLQRFPQGQYMDDAHYWLGEIYFIQNHDKDAMAEFKSILRDYPQSTKVPASMLKLGYIYLDNGQTAPAKIEFKQLIFKYPQSTAAQLAKTRLEQITKNPN